MSEQDQQDQVPPVIPLAQEPVPEAPEAQFADRPVSPEAPLVPPAEPKRPVNLDGLAWGGILIWAGLVLGANHLGYLDALGIRGFALTWDLPFRPAVWTLIFLGVALIIGLDIVVRLSVPVYRRNVLGYLILVIVSLSVGLGRLGLMWPLILITLGLALLLRR